MIVCIGWGSLIWCPKALPVASTWRSDGPDLPVEFARESGGRRITLVICDGRAAITVLWAALEAPTLDDAKRALAMREGIQPKNIRRSIGYWSPADVSEHTETSAIGRWAIDHAIHGVVWTALKPKIGDNYRVPTQEEVIRYLDALTGSDRADAEEYVRLAPRQIVTPYRTAIEAELGWTASGFL